MNKIHQISAEHLSIEQIGEIIKNGTKLELSEDARQRIIRCREYLDNKIKESETPIYGVILVTTKRGEEGKMHVNYQGSMGWNRPTVLPEMANAVEFAKMWNAGVTNANSSRL